MTLQGKNGVLCEVKEEDFPLKFTVQKKNGPQTYTIYLNYEKKDGVKTKEIKSVNMG